MLSIDQLEYLYPGLARRKKLWPKVEELVKKGVYIQDFDFPPNGHYLPFDGSPFVPNDKLTRQLKNRYRQMQGREKFSDSYLCLLGRVVEYGDEKHNARTGSFTKGFYDQKITADLSYGIPLAGLRRHAPRVAAVELAWMMTGSANIEFMKKHNVRIWDKFADAAGNIGAAYGERMLGDEFNNQLKRSIEKLKGEPSSRQNLISYWHPGEDVTPPGDRSLVPCPVDVHWRVNNEKKLCATFHYRSSDFAVGFPVDSMRDCLMVDAMAAEIGVRPGGVTWNLDDVHVYDTHLAAVKALKKKEDRIVSFPPFPKETLAGAFPLPRWSLSQIAANPDAYVDLVKHKGQKAKQPKNSFKLDAVGAVPKPK